eukprot:gene7079-12719_t
MAVIDAVVKGDTEKLARLIANEHDINHTDSFGNTALHLAQCPAILRQLISVSRDINIRNMEGDTPLHCWYQLHIKSPNFVFDFDKKKNMMSMLIDAGADCDIQNNLGYTVLHTVFIYGGSAGHILTEQQINELIKLVVVDGHADVNKADFELQLPIHHAVCESYFNPVRLLLEWGSEINAKNIWGGTPLYLLSSSDDEDLIKLLLQNGADPLVQDHHGMTCLHESSTLGNITFMALVINHEQNSVNENKQKAETLLVNIRDINGASAIQLAAAYKSIEATTLLLSCGALLNTPDDYGSTSLHYGAFGGTIEIVTMLVESGADIHALDNNGSTPIQIALNRNYFETASAIQKAAEALGNTFEGSPTNEGLQIEQKFTADNMFSTYVMEGNLYSNPFDISHVDETLFEELGTVFEGDFEGYLKEMAKVEGVGMIPDHEEVKQIEKEIENFIQRVVVCIGEIDPRFKGSVLQSGSWYEGTKVGDPDEFDFMLCLTEFQKQCSIQIQDNQIDDIQVLKNKMSSGLTGQFFQDGKLQGGKLMEKFVSLAKQALCRIGYKSGCKNLNFQGITSHTLVENTWVSHGTVTCELKFTWTGPRYKGLIITTDLVPAIFVQKWPSFADSSFLTTKLATGGCGCHVVPKLGKWRLSFSLAERMVFDSLSKEVKQAYARAKIALHPASATCFFTVGKEDDFDEEGFLSDEEAYIDEEDEMGVIVNEKEEDNNSNEMKEEELRSVQHASKIVRKGHEEREETRKGKEKEEEGRQDLSTKRFFIDCKGKDEPKGIEKDKTEPEKNDLKCLKTDEVEKLSRVNAVDILRTTEEPPSCSFVDLEKGNTEKCAIPNAQERWYLTNDTSALRKDNYEEEPRMASVKLDTVMHSRLLSNETVSALKLEDSVAAKVLLEELKEGDQITLNYYSKKSSEPRALEAKSLIPSYLLKLVLFKCLEQYDAQQKQSESISTAMIYRELKNCLEKNEPVPYFFCKKRDFLPKVITSKEKRCAIAFIVTFLCALFEKFDQNTN